MHSEGETIFHLAIANYDKSVCLELVKCFVGAGGNTTICNSKGESALYTAIRCGYTSVAELLISHKVPLPHDILPFALQQHSSLQLVWLLSCNGADMHSTSPEGETVFHLAIANYNESMCLELVKIFVESGSNTNVCNSMEESVLQTAFAHRHISVVELLFSHDNPLDIQPRIQQEPCLYCILHLYRENTFLEWWQTLQTIINVAEE